MIIQSYFLTRIIILVTWGRILILFVAWFRKFIFADRFRVVFVARLGITAGYMYNVSWQIAGVIRGISPVLARSPFSVMQCYAIGREIGLARACTDNNYPWTLSPESVELHYRERDRTGLTGGIAILLIIICFMLYYSLALKSPLLVWWIGENLNRPIWRL